MLTEHLLESGREKIVHVTGPRDTRAVRERVFGITERLAGAGLELAGPVAYGEWSQRWGRRAAEDLLAASAPFDAVICGSDQIAAGVVQALALAGRRIPEDVAVTGYDNWPVFALESEPELTTIDMRLDELGAAAVRDLFSIIDGDIVHPGIRTHVGELVIRGSSRASG